MFDPISFFKKQPAKETAKMLREFLVKMEKLSEHEKAVITKMMRGKVKGKVAAHEIEHAFKELEVHLVNEMNSDEIAALRKVFISFF